MGNSRKIFFLILLLIILIISCIYFQAESIYNNNSAKPLKMVEKIVEPLENDVEEIKVVESVEVKQEPVVQIINSEIEPVKISEEIEQKEPIVKQEPAKVEEKKIEFPLFITDAKYKRTNGDMNIEEMSEETQLLQKELNELALINPIEFKKYRPLKKSYSSIESIAKFLKEHKHLKVEVAGHTTNVGKMALNKQTSVFQAANVKKALIKLGINKKRMKARGYGELIPLVEDGSLEVNKRIEFNIIGEKYKW